MYEDQDQKTATEQIRHAVDSDTAIKQDEGAIEAPVGTPENPSSAIFTVANFITLCRLILTLFFLFLFLAVRFVEKRRWA